MNLHIQSRLCFLYVSACGQVTKPMLRNIYEIIHICTAVVDECGE